MGEIGDGSAMSTYYFDDIVFATGPVPGCTDPQANNYNPSATLMMEVVLTVLLY